jgi:ribosomal subunit interface protein
MRIVEITGKNMDLTAGIKGHVEDKVEGITVITQKFEPCDLRVEVGKTGRHHKSGDIYVAEFNLTIPGTMLRSVSKSDDLYRAIDQVTEELKRQVKRYKQKLLRADRVATNKEVVEEEWVDDEVEVEEEEVTGSLPSTSHDK